MPIKAKQYHFTPIPLSKIKRFKNAKFLWEVGTVVLEGVQIVSIPLESNLEISSQSEDIQP
jgi:hypothetical protein